MTDPDIALIRHAYESSDTAMGVVLEKIDYHLFDLTSKEESLSDIRSALINARSVLRSTLAIKQIPIPHGLPRRTDGDGLDPNAA
jgi:hypothetical protein